MDDIDKVLSNVNRVLIENTPGRRDNNTSSEQSSRNRFGYAQPPNIGKKHDNREELRINTRNGLGYKISGTPIAEDEEFEQNEIYEEHFETERSFEYFDQSCNFDELDIGEQFEEKNYNTYQQKNLPPSILATNHFMKAMPSNDKSLRVDVLKVHEENSNAYNYLCELSSYNHSQTPLDIKDQVKYPQGVKMEKNQSLKRLEIDLHEGENNSPLHPKTSKVGEKIS